MLGRGCRLCDEQQHSPQQARSLSPSPFRCALCCTSMSPLGHLKGAGCLAALLICPLTLLLYLFLTLPLLFFFVPFSFFCDIFSSPSPLILKSRYPLTTDHPILPHTHHKLRPTTSSLIPTVSFPFFFSLSLTPTLYHKTQTCHCPFNFDSPRNSNISPRIVSLHEGHVAVTPLLFLDGIPPLQPLFSGRSSFFPRMATEVVSEGVISLLLAHLLILHWVILLLCFALCRVCPQCCR